MTSYNGVMGIGKIWVMYEGKGFLYRQDEYLAFNQLSASTYSVLSWLSQSVYF